MDSILLPKASSAKAMERLYQELAKLVEDPYGATIDEDESKEGVVAICDNEIIAVALRENSDGHCVTVKTFAKIADDEYAPHVRYYFRDNGTVEGEDCDAKVKFSHLTWSQGVAHLITQLIDDIDQSMRQLHDLKFTLTVHSKMVSVED